MRDLSPDHPGLDHVLPPRLLGPNLLICRPSGLADAVGMGQAATPDEEQRMGQGPLLQADPIAGVELRGRSDAGVGHRCPGTATPRSSATQGQGAHQSPGPGCPALLGRAAAEETGGSIPLQATAGTPPDPGLCLRRMRRPVRPGRGRRHDGRAPRQAAPQGRRGRDGEPAPPASMVPSSAPSAGRVQDGRGLSRMRDNSHVRFLGEEVAAMRSPYPTTPTERARSAPKSSKDGRGRAMATASRLKSGRFC